MYYRHIRMENEIPKYFGLIQKISYFMGYRKYLNDITGQFSTYFHHAIDYFTASGTFSRRKVRYELLLSFLTQNWTHEGQMKIVQKMDLLWALKGEYLS